MASPSDADEPGQPSPDPDGFGDVPPHAASHGCVRVSIQAMDWLWANDRLPIGTDVLVYGSPI